MSKNMEYVLQFIYTYIIYINMHLKWNKKYNLITYNSTPCICEKYMAISTIVLEQFVLL